MKAARLVVLAVLLGAVCLPLNAQVFSVANNGIVGNLCEGLDANGNSVMYFMDTTNNLVGQAYPDGSVLEWGPVPGTNLAGCAFGPNKLLYFGAQDQLTIISFNPVTLAFTPHVIPTSNGFAPNGLAGMTFDAAGVLTAVGPKGALIYRMRTNGTFLPTIHIPGAISNPNGRWPHGPSLCGGLVWFVEIFGNRIDSLTTTGVLQTTPLLSGDNTPFSTACGSDGVYFSMESKIGKIGRINMVSRAITHWLTPTSASQPMGIAVSSKGKVEVGEDAAGKIAIMPVGGGTIQEVPAGGHPNKLASWSSQGTVAFGFVDVKALGVL